MVLDEVHEANNKLSEYGLILPFIAKCPDLQRPRILALTASPSGTNSEMRETISNLCSKLDAMPYSPLLDDDENTDEANDVLTKYVEVQKSMFETTFELFIFETLDSLSRLHTFYVSNWKTIPVNQLLKTKVNMVLKCISHAPAVALKDNDRHLKQLTQFMSKLIDTIDMLQIFGPRKLLKYIKDDLDFASQNDALTEIFASISPTLRNMRSEVTQLEKNYEIVDDSPRVANLLTLLKHYKSDQQRILIFVERRNTAERLCRRLKEDLTIRQMNPDYVIGNADGGFPKEMQHSVLEKFAKGECQVLVATSVLEQGIDVAACGVVICFDGIKTMKSVIQSRGRARKRSASFIVFVNVDGQQKINQMTAMEQLLNNVIIELMSDRDVSLDPEYTKEIGKFLDGSREEVAGAIDVVEEDVEIDLELNLDSDEEKNLFTIQFSNHVDAVALADHIRSFFKSPLDRVKVLKKKVIAQFAGLESDSDRLNIIKVIKIA